MIIHVIVRHKPVPVFGREKASALPRKFLIFVVPVVKDAKENQTCRRRRREAATAPAYRNTTYISLYVKKFGLVPDSKGGRNWMSPQEASGIWAQPFQTRYSVFLHSACAEAKQCTLSAPFDALTSVKESKSSVSACRVDRYSSCVLSRKPVEIVDSGFCA